MSRKNGGSRGRKKWRGENHSYREKSYRDMDDDEVRARLAMPVVREYFRGALRNSKPKRANPLTSA